MRLSRIFSDERYVRNSTLAALCLSVVTLIPLFSIIRKADEALIGALISCMVALFLFASVALVFWKRSTFVAPRSLALLAAAPIFVLSMISLIGGPSSRAFLFGTGFEFGTPGLFAILALLALIGSLASVRFAMPFMIGMSTLGALYAGIIAWRVWHGDLSSFEAQQLPFIIACSIIVSVSLSDTATKIRHQVIAAGVALLAMVGFYLIRVPEAAIAGVIALVAVITLPRVLSGVTSRIPAASLVAIALFGLIFLFSPRLESVGFTATERPTFVQTSSIVSREYAFSLHNALIGTGPLSSPYAWNMYRPTEMNRTQWWNKTPVVTHSAATSIAMMFGLLGLASFCLFPAALVMLLVNSRLHANDASIEFRTSGALAAYCFAAAFLYPVGATILVFGSVALGIAARHFRVQDVIEFRTHDETRLALLAIGVVAGIVFLYTGTYQLLAIHHHARGVAYVEQGSLTLAAIPLQKAVVAWPIASYQINAAQATFGAAIGIAEEQKAAGVLDLEAFGALATHALNYTERAARTDPRNMDTLLSRSALYAVLYSAGFTSTQASVDLAETITRQLDSEAELAPTRADIVLNQAIFAKLQGDVPKARAAAQKALRLKPDYEEAQAFLDALPTE